MRSDATTVEDYLAELPADRLEAIEAHQPSHFFNQINFPLQILPSRRRCNHFPSVFVGCELATQGRQTVFDAAVIQVFRAFRPVE